MKVEAYLERLYEQRDGIQWKIDKLEKLKADILSMEAIMRTKEQWRTAQQADRERKLNFLLAVSHDMTEPPIIRENARQMAARMQAKDALG